MRITLKIFAVIIALLSFWNLFSAERESYKVISRTYDGSSVQPVDVGISFFSEDLSNIQFEEDGICIKGDGYECYNGVIRAIQNNDMTELRKHALEHGFNEILKPVWLKNINSAFQEMKPELVKIVKFGDYKVFFVKFPREHDSKHRGFHISVKNIDGKDFWISYFEETLGYALGMIGDILNEEMIIDDADYKYSFPFTDGEDAIRIHFNGEKVSKNLLDDELENPSDVLLFCQKVYRSISNITADGTQEDQAFQEILNDWIGRKQIAFMMNEEPVYRDDWIEYPQVLSIVNISPEYHIVYYKDPSTSYTRIVSRVIRKSEENYTVSYRDPSTSSFRQKTIRNTGEKYHFADRFISEYSGELVFQFFNQKREEIAEMINKNESEPEGGEES